MKVSGITKVGHESLPEKLESTSSKKPVSPNLASINDMQGILKTLRDSFAEHDQQSVDLSVPIEDFLQLRNGNQVLGANKAGDLTSIEICSSKVQVKHFKYAFTGIVANPSETQAFLPTQEGKLIVLDIYDIFKLTIINEIQCFTHPVDAIRIQGSNMLTAYDFNGNIETFKYENSQIQRVESVEYQTIQNASSMVSPDGNYLLYYNNQSLSVIDRSGTKIYERDRQTRNCSLSDTLFAYMTESLEEDEIHVRRLADPYNLFLTISPEKKDKINELYLSEDSLYLMGVLNHQSTKMWELFDQKKESEIDLDTSGLIQLRFGKNRAILYSTSNSFCFKSFFEFHTHKSLGLDNPELFTENLQDNKIVISSRNGLNEIDLETGKAKEYFLPQGTSVTALKHFEGDKFCLGISEKSSYIMRIQSLNSPDTEKEPCVSLESQAVCIEVAKNKDMVFVGCRGGKIVTINTFNWTIKDQMFTEGIPTSLLYIEDYGLICGLDNGFIQKIGHPESFECQSDSITSLAYSSKGMLVSCSNDGRIGIWNLEDLGSPIALLDFPATTIQVSKSGQFLYSINTSGIFKCWCLETFNCLFTEDYSGYHSFFITESERNMLLIDGTSLKIIDGPLNDKVRVTGTSKKNDFIDYIRKIITGKKVPEFEEETEKGIILPFMIAPTHLYVAYNLAQHLKQSLLCGSPVFNSSNGLNPLNLAADGENRECFLNLIKSLKRSSNPHALGFVNTDTLISMNKCDVPGLSKLYDLLFQRSRATLSTHITTSTRLPQYNLSDIKTIKQNEFDFTGDSKPQTVAYWESQFKLNLESGSLESMEFLRSIVESKNNQFLTSNFMKNYLRFKWRQVKWAIYSRSFLYLIFLFSVVHTLYMEIENAENLSSYVTVLFVLNILITLSDIIQMLGGFRIYLENIWNLTVIARTVTVFVYVATVWVEFDRSLFGFFVPNDVHIALATWPFIQGFSYFRVFTPTRYMVHLFVQVVMDIKVFMVLLFYTVFCIACILYVILDLESDSLVDYFLTSGALSFANFDVETFYGRPSTAIFAILVNTLVMLNLLIAIIGDTYDKVQESKEVTNNRELAKLMLEVEPMMYWKRNKNSLKYFHMCGKDDSDHGNTEWLGRIREVKLILKKQDKDIKETKRNLDLFRNQTDQKLDLILGELGRVKQS